jgi:hypothetical protein
MSTASVAGKGRKKTAERRRLKRERFESPTIQEEVLTPQSSSAISSPGRMVPSIKTAP